MLVIFIAACDFENPSDFEVPVWFIDIKLPLVSKRFPMGDLVDTTNFIYPTDDSAGFQILFSGEIDPPVGTEDTDLSVRFANGYLENSVNTPSSGGIDGSVLEDYLPTIFPPITTALSSPPVIITGIPNYYPGRLEDPDEPGQFTEPVFFELPLAVNGVDVDSIHMLGSDYNDYFVDRVNDVFNVVLTPFNDLGVQEMPFSLLLAETSLDLTIDSLVFAGGSYFESKFKNHGYPTKLVGSYGLFEHGTFENDPLSTIAFHGDTVGAGLQSGDSLTFLDSLVGGLAQLFRLTYAYELEEAVDDELVVIHRTDDGLMGITYDVELFISGFDAMKVTMGEVPLDIGSMLTDITDQLSFGSTMPEGDTTTTLEIRSASMMREQDNDGNPLLPLHANKITISELKSTLPFDIGLLFGLPNFIGGDPVIIDEVLRQEDEAITRTFNLAGTTLEATGEGVIGNLELDLAITNL